MSKKHTGKIHHHHGKTSHLEGHGAKDPHASAEYHAENKKHGMPHGMTHSGDGSGGTEEGGEGMAGNCEYC